MPADTLVPPAEVAPPRPRLSETRVTAYIALGLVVAIVCVYALIVRADFIAYDDNSHVYDNPLVKNGFSWHNAAQAFTSSQASLWIPLTWISLMVDVSLFGLNPGAMHAVNVAWHIAATVLLFFTLRRMTKDLWASAFVAALFGLHPLNVESVAWVAERKSVLGAFFWIASIAAYTRYVEKPRLAPYIATLLGAALSLLAKPMAVTLPCTLLLLDFWPFGRWRTTKWWRLALEKVPFFLFAAMASRMAMHARRTEAIVTTETLSMASRVSNALISYVVYLEKLFVPINLGVLYPHPAHPQPVLAGLATLFLVVVTVLALRVWKTQPWFIMGWCWFIGVLVPVIGLVQVGSQARADRFTYVPQIGLFIAVTWLVKEHWRWKANALRGLALAAIVGCALVSSLQVSYWLDGVTLFEHTIEVTENNASAYANAGMHREHQGDYEKAIEHFQASLRITPDQAMVWREFGISLLKLDKPKDAIRALQMAVKNDPADYMARFELGLTLEKQGALDEAIAEFTKILEAVPKSVGSHYYLARALEGKGQHDAALAELREAAKLAPGQGTVAETLRAVEAGKGGVGAFPEL